MKKRFSALTVGIIAFLMLATGVAAGSFTRWSGEQHTENTIANLDAINSGINGLKTDLGNKEQDLLDKQAELDKAIADSNADKDNITSLEGDITSLEGDVASLKGNIASLEGRLENSLEGVTLEELKTLTSNTNSESGLRHKYDTLKDGINKYLNSQEGASATDKLNEHNGKEAEDNQLKEALKDVKRLEEKSGEVLSNLQGTNNEDSTPEEETTEEDL